MIKLQSNSALSTEPEDFTARIFRWVSIPCFCPFFFFYGVVLVGSTPLDGSEDSLSDFDACKFFFPFNFFRNVATGTSSEADEEDEAAAATGDFRLARAIAEKKMMYVNTGFSVS